MTATTDTPALRVLRRMFDEGFATGDDTVVDDLCAPDLVEHQFGLAGAGPAAIEHVKAAIRDVHAAAPDLRFTIEDAVESGDTIWVRARGVGTATGPFFGAPSGNAVDFSIVEHWGVPDRFAMRAQTGVLARLS